MLLTIYLGSFVFSYLTFQSNLDKCEKRILKENINKEIKEDTKIQVVLKELSILFYSLIPIFSIPSSIYIIKNFDEFFNFVKQLNIFEVENNNLETYRYLLKSGFTSEEIRIKKSLAKESMNTEPKYVLDDLENYLSKDETLEQNKSSELDLLNSYLDEQDEKDDIKIRILK